MRNFVTVPRLVRLVNNMRGDVDLKWMNAFCQNVYLFICFEALLLKQSNFE